MSDKRIETIIGGSALASERTVSWIRILLCGSEVIRTFLCARRPSGEEALMLFPLIFAILFSLYTLFVYRATVARSWLLLSSVSADAAVAFAALLPNIIFPGPNFPGILGIPDTAVILIITLGTGFRLSVASVILGGTLNYLSLGGLLLIDVSHNGPRYLVSSPPIALFCILMTIIVILALIIAMRTRRLIKKAAEEGLRAQQAQTELAHAEKLVTIGTIAAGIGHEINNPNNALLLSLESQKKIWDELRPVLDSYAKEHGDFEIGGYHYSELREEMPQSIGRAIGNSERIRKIVQDLRAFARKDEGSYDEAINLNDVVANALQLAGVYIKKAGKLKLELAPFLPPIKGNGQRLEQVVINLLQNAAQALENNDKCIIISTVYDLAAREISLCVSDQGRGMDQEELKRVFEPFFTTKGKTEGTGLGLSICKRIVTAHKGRISISSQQGKGTQVTVTIPQP